MDRERRLANLRKLQLPGTTKRSNCNIAVNGAIAPPTTSSDANIPAQQRQPHKYHYNVEEHARMPEYESRPYKRTKLDAFIYKDPKQITNHATPCKSPKNDDDFIVQIEHAKKAPQSKKSKVGVSKSTSNNASNKAKAKKQSTLKSALLRNERMFAEIAAQHCAVEQFDGDEIQMALAISKSEINNYAESSASKNFEAETNNLENIVGIREKLQKYGFRTASKKDYQTFAANFWSTPNRRKGKCKWANKFTALTLRNPAIQYEKLQQKIESTLNLQKDFSNENCKEHSAVSTYALISNILRQCHQSVLDRSLIRKNVQDESVKLEEYFVKELFTVNHVPCGHLLKNWSMIPGRCRSPTATDVTATSVKDKGSITNVKQLQDAYKDLEDYFAETQKEEEMQAQNNSYSQTDQPNMNILDTTVALVQDAQPPSSQTQIISKIKQLAEATCNSLSSQRRLSSPDLFDDSDVEVPVNMTPIKESAKHESKNTNNEAENVYSKSMEESSDVTTYELFTSDDVKNITTIQQFNNNALVNEDIILQTPNKQDLEKTSIIGKTFQQKKSCDHTAVKEKYTQSSSVRRTKDFLDKAKFSKSNVNDDEDEKIFQKLREKYLGNISIKAQEKATQNNMNELGTLCITLSPSSESSILTSASLSPPPLMLSQIMETGSSQSNLIKLNHSIDLTQNERYIAMASSFKDDDDFIILSDDDINYSIRKANHQDSTSLTCKQSETNSKINENFISFDLLEEQNVKYCTSTRKRLRYLEKECKSLHENFQKSFYGSNNEDFNFTFLSSPSERTTTVMRQQKSKEKFHIFLSSEDLSILVSSPSSSSLKNRQDNEIDGLLGFDEFDRQLIYESNRTLNNNFDNTPQGLEELLKGELKFPPTQSVEHSPTLEIQATENIDRTDKTAQVQQIKIQGKTFIVRIDATEKPDFTRLTDGELLKRLYDFGIKPLKRRHSIKLLEYIYNQTHPIIVNNENANSSKYSLNTLHTSSPPVRSTSPLSCGEIAKSLEIVENCSNTKKSRKLILHDASGADILHSRITLKPELPNENYILPTNVNKKTSQPLLPLHIAWYNLICSNYNLYETILMYEPIDLQDIYLFFKNLGYRYDPKDLKKFFDERCIIFRYDLGANGSDTSASNRERQRNRHIRRTKSKN